MLTNRLRKLISQAHSRQARKKSDIVLAEGSRCCKEAISRRPDWLEDVLFSIDFADSKAGQEISGLLAKLQLSPIIVPHEAFRKLSETETSPGVMAILRRPEPAPPIALPRPFALILDQVSEPGNLGTILRTAWAVGLPSVWLIQGGADPFAPKVIRAGMGAQFALELAWLPNLTAAADALSQLGGGKLWCAMPKAEISLFDEEFFLSGGGLVLGNEAHGISHPELGVAVTIPMPGEAESLNVAQAATVFLCECCLRRPSQVSR